MNQTSNKFAFQGTPKIGVLMTNLGTPDAPTKSAVRTYLKEFLSDPRVVEPPPPRWIWLMILNLIILNTRPKKSAKAYQSVWNTHGKGSPLLSISREQKRVIEVALNKQHPDKFVVTLGMRYGNPSISSAVAELKSNNCDRIVVLPLYPQTTSSTNGSTFDEVNRVIRGWENAPELKLIDGYNDDKLYIESLANSVVEFQKENGSPELLLMSYHGIPKRYAERGDKYPSHCNKTSHLLAERLNLEPNQYKMSFQSRLGGGQWIKEYTDEVLCSLPYQGIKNVQVICPGFASDCLETIEEICDENKSYFMSAGGHSYEYIPSLNVRKDHIECLTQMIIKKSDEFET